MELRSMPTRCEPQIGPPLLRDGWIGRIGDGALVFLAGVEEGIEVAGAI